MTPFPAILPTVPFPCAVLVRGRPTVPPAIEYWIRFGVAWGGEVSRFIYYNCGVAALEGQPFEGTIIDWALP